MIKDLGYEALANGIIIQAANDYRKALKRLYQHPNDYEAKSEIRELERFFRSDWYEFLTDVDGEYMIKRLREDFRERMAEKEKKAKEKAAKEAAKKAAMAAVKAN